MPWVNGTRLLLEPAMHGATGNLYCGLHEWPDMAFVLHLLRPEDTFADIGGNVGTYTLLAAGSVGSRCESFEPVDASFRLLERQVAFNNLQHRVTLHQICIGAEAGQLRFSTDRGPMNQVAGSSYSGLASTVPVQAIDQLSTLRSSACWKLDVKGHEEAVLAGAIVMLAEAPPAVILCENRSPSVQRRLINAGFHACSYNPWQRALRTDSSATGDNQIWVRPMNWVKDRLHSAPAFMVNGESI
jgi:FkbM family methyltransferase